MMPKPESKSSLAPFPLDRNNPRARVIEWRDEQYLRFGFLRLDKHSSRFAAGGSTRTSRRRAHRRGDREHGQERAARVGKPPCPGVRALAQMEVPANAAQQELGTDHKRAATPPQETSGAKSKLAQASEDAYGDAILESALQTGLAEETFPSSCPFLENQILDDDYWPE